MGKIWLSFDNDSSVKFEDPATPKTIILNTVMGSNNTFTRVRHVPEGKEWHKADDNLEGTAEYGNSSLDSSPWSIKFNNQDFEYFLFMSGDA